MTKFPDFSTQGYQVVSQLGQNWNAGRSTYKALIVKDEYEVVIKQFRFHQGNWDSYKEIEREIKTLAKLKHPAIPKYLETFETEDSVCLVQEYKDASPLSLSNLKPNEIKEVAIQILEIIVYLQSRSIPIFHRDIKPDNILLDSNSFKVYLVDFGLAKEASTGTLGLSTMFGGTPGFCPPEQLLARRLTCASDLYSLGATLIYLLSGNQSINELINHNFEIDFHSSIPKNISFAWREWLSKMVQPDYKKRFNNAAVALQSLRPIEPIIVDSLVKESPKPEEKKLENSRNQLNQIIVAPTLTALAIAGIIVYVLPPVVDKIKQLLLEISLIVANNEDFVGIFALKLALHTVNFMLMLTLSYSPFYLVRVAKNEENIKPVIVSILGMISLSISFKIVINFLLGG